MTDPVYNYVKGQGWVIGPDVDSVTVTLKCGRLCRIEFRNPLRRFL